MTWLWGPPGTGKTSTLSVLVEELYERGDRIFLTAPTNTAVDIAMQGALGRIHSFESGSVVRVGQPVDQTLVGRPAGKVLVDEVAEERGEPIATRKMQVAEQIRRLRAAISRPGPGHEDRSADELELAELSAMSRALDSLMKEMRRQVCRDARLVAATAHQSVLSTLSGLPYDVVVVDEASMMSAALCMLASGAGSGHTVIAGDFRQLPPVVISDTSPATRWLRRSAFEAAGISARVTRNDPPGNLIALTEQYRMPEPLADALSDGFYPENRLTTAESVRQRGATTTFEPPAPIVFIDTTALRTRVARRGGSASRYNLLHALVAACLLEDVTAVGNQPALITPFAPQARLLESLVGEGSDGGIASTVHRFQGGETDVVIFDAVDAELGDLPIHPWFETGEEGTDGARLVNVAMSRARQRLVILADLKRVHRRRLGRDAMSRFFRTAARDADFLNPWNVLGTAATPGLDTKRMIADIDAASSVVELWSDQVSADTVQALRPALAGAAARGCSVTIWHQPLPNGDLPRALEPLAKSMMLRPCLPVRESSGVIDDVVWGSSKGILGPEPGATIRFRSRALAEAVLRMTRRREYGPLAGTGRPAGNCACGRLIVRDETRQPAAALCLNCDAGPTPWRRRA